MTSTSSRSRRESNGVGQLGGGHRSQGDRAAAQGVTETGVFERPVEVVGPQRGDDADGGGRSVGERDHHLEERPPIPFVDRLGEQLLELVDDEEHPGVSGDDLADHVVQCVRSGREPADDVRRGHVGYPLE